jgi:adenosylhomocysteine nucleosidase
MFCIFAALEAEIRGLKKRIIITRTRIRQDCRISEGRLAGNSVLLILTGIGEKRAKAAAQYVLENFPVDALVSSGFAGALNDKLNVGDIAIYNHLLCQCTREDFADGALQVDPALLKQCTKSARECGVPGLIKQGISISRVCAAPREKAKLGRDSGADVVDMESFWICQIAAERNVPFIAVRAISDSLEDDLSLLSHITVGGQVRPLMALGYFFHHPSHLRTAAALLTNARKAGKNLALFLDKLAGNVQT